MEPVSEARAALTAWQVAATSLFATLEASLHTGDVRPWAFEDALADLTGPVSQRLEAALVRVDAHQRAEEDLNRVRRELDAKADKMRRLSALLSKFEAKLGALGSEASELVAAREEARDVAPDMVVNMARKLAYTNAAPEGWHWTLGVAMPAPYTPPHPTTDMMKKGVLYAPRDELEKLYS